MVETSCLNEIGQAGCEWWWRIAKCRRDAAQAGFPRGCPCNELRTGIYVGFSLLNFKSRLDAHDACLAACLSDLHLSAEVEPAQRLGGRDVVEGEKSLIFMLIYRLCVVCKFFKTTIYILYDV